MVLSFLVYFIVICMNVCAFANLTKSILYVYCLWILAWATNFQISKWNDSDYIPIPRWTPPTLVLSQCCTVYISQRCNSCFCGKSNCRQVLFNFCCFVLNVVSSLPTWEIVNIRCRKYVVFLHYASTDFIAVCFTL